MLANFMARQTCFYGILHLFPLLSLLFFAFFFLSYPHCIVISFHIYFIATATIDLFHFLNKQNLPCCGALGIVHDEGQVVLATVHYLITIVAETILKLPELSLPS